jgi:hypothetical protein
MYTKDLLDRALLRGGSRSGSMRRRNFKKACCRESLHPLVIRKGLGLGYLSEVKPQNIPQHTLLHRSSREAAGVGVDALRLLNVPGLSVLGHGALIVRRDESELASTLVDFVVGNLGQLLGGLDVVLLLDEALGEDQVDLLKGTTSSLWV